MYDVTSNPILGKKNFEYTDGQMSTSLNGVINRCLILLAIVMGSAFFAWNSKYASPEVLASKLTLFAVAGLITAIVTVVKKEWAGYTSPLYAIFEGLVLGSLSKLFEAQFSGIVIQAVALTFGVAAGMLLLYKYGIVRVTDRFRGIVVTATLAICAVYLISFVLSLFGHGASFMASTSPIALIFQLFVVVIAALNLFLDFDFIAKVSNRGLPSYMGWFAAFGLMVTLIWLYVEILHFLAKMKDSR